MATLEHLLSVALSYVEDGIAASHKHFGVLINLQALRDRLDHVVKELDNSLVKLVLVVLFQSKIPWLAVCRSKSKI